MKTISRLTLLSTLFVYCSCNFSVGAQKNLSTGLSFKYNGLLVRKMVLVGPDNKEMTDNKVQLNTQVAIIAAGITNYELKDGKVYPGMTLTVTDKNGLAVIQGDDLLPGMVGYPADTAADLRGSLTVGQPMRSGETYHMKLHVWDKIKPSNELNAEADLVVK